MRINERWVGLQRKGADITVLIMSLSERLLSIASE